MPEATQSWVKDTLLLTLIIGLVYSMFLSTRPLSAPDEGRYSEIPREMVASGDYITPHLNGVKYFEKPALFYWLQSLSIKAFGLHEWALRLVTALMGVLGCLTTYWGTRVLYDRTTALLAAFLLASSLLYAGLANFITLDMTVSVFLTGSLLCFLVSTRLPLGPKRRNYLWLMYALAGLATLTKGLIGALFPGMIIFAWLCCTRQWRALSSYYLVSGTGLFFAITLPWHILVQLKNPEFFQFYFIEQHFLRYFTNYADRVQPKWFFPLILTLGFFPWTGFLLSTLKRQWPVLAHPRAHSTEIYLLLWASLIFLFYWLSKSQLSPYILPVFTPLAILTGRYLHLHWQQHSLKFGFYVGLALSLLLSLGIAIYAHLLLLQPLTLIDFFPLSSLFFALSVYCYQQRHLQAGLMSMMAGALFILALVNVDYDFFDHRSIKVLAMELNQLLGPTETVYNFNHYHQDLPFYLKRRVKVVNWKGELTFGSQHQDVDDILLDENKLTQEWSSRERKFLISKTCDLAYLRDHLNLAFFLIDTQGAYALISNKALTPTESGN